LSGSIFLLLLKEDVRIISVVVSGICFRIPQWYSAVFRRAEAARVPEPLQIEISPASGGSVSAYTLPYQDPKNRNILPDSGRLQFFSFSSNLMVSLPLMKAPLLRDGRLRALKRTFTLPGERSARSGSGSDGSESKMALFFYIRHSLQRSS
jgi:hypothetical protein